MLFRNTIYPNHLNNPLQELPLNNPDLDTDNKN